jgi:hypothetical protein
MEKEVLPVFAWNRAEALVTLSLDYYLRVQALLNQHQIRMQSKQVPVPQDMHSEGYDMLKRPTTEYYIYVHKDDLEQARQLIRELGPETQRSVEELTW